MYTHVEGYKGAFPPCLKVPILADSAGRPGSWDEKTASGLLAVTPGNVIAIDETSGSQLGTVDSKVIVIDPDKIAISGIFANFHSQYASRGVSAGEHWREGTSYAPGDNVPAGRYALRGSAAIVGETYVAEGEVVIIPEGGGSFSIPSESVGEPRLVELLDSNIVEYMELRTCPTVYAFVTQDQPLQAGGVYLNCYDKEIKYRGATVVPGESFVAEVDGDTFTCPADAEYRVAVIFDDNRVPKQLWVPSQFWGEYFGGYKGRALAKDDDGVAYGSGSYLAWITRANGGMAEDISRRIAQARYIQLRVTVRRGQNPAEQ